MFKTTTSVLLIVQLKCMLSASHAAPGEYANWTDSQIDRHYTFRQSRCGQHNDEVLTWLLIVSLERSNSVDSWVTWALRLCSVPSSFSRRRSSCDLRSEDVSAITSHLLARIWFCVCSDSICCCSDRLSTSQLSDLRCHSCIVTQSQPTLFRQFTTSVITCQHIQRYKSVIEVYNKNDTLCLKNDHLYKLNKIIYITKKSILLGKLHQNMCTTEW